MGVKLSDLVTGPGRVSPETLLDALAVVLDPASGDGWYEPDVEQVRSEARRIVRDHASAVIREKLQARALNAAPAQSDKE